MKEILTTIAVVVLVVQAFIGLCFFISCLWEGERRASFFAGLQLAVMLLMLFLFFYLASIGYFQTTLGLILLVIALLTTTIAFILLARRTTPNLKALKGTKGLIVALVSRNRWARRLFKMMDDIFYGRKPKSKTPPLWARLSS